MPRMPIHPGETLQDVLEEQGMTASALARALSVPKNRITAILNGTRSITGDTALRLGHYFAMSPEFWLNLQKIYELRLATIEKGQEIAELPKLERAQ